MYCLYCYKEISCWWCCFNIPAIAELVSFQCVILILNILSINLSSIVKQRNIINMWSLCFVISFQCSSFKGKNLLVEWVKKTTNHELHQYDTCLVGDNLAYNFCDFTPKNTSLYSFIFCVFLFTFVPCLLVNSPQESFLINLQCPRMLHCSC